LPSILVTLVDNELDAVLYELDTLTKELDTATKELLTRANEAEAVVSTLAVDSRFVVLVETLEE